MKMYDARLFIMSNAQAEAEVQDHLAQKAGVGWRLHTFAFVRGDYQNSPKDSPRVYVVMESDH